MERLRKVFTDLCDHPASAQLWDAIAKEYSGTKRHYHNLNHLSNMLDQLEQCRHLVDDWNSILFALFYHDYIYKSTAKDNEEKSAEAADNALRQLGIGLPTIDLVSKLILATKHHQVSPDNDINIFTDADLSILGSPAEAYDEYARQVRKEYSIYPDILYNPGRKKVLNHFLEMQSMFKTSFFKDKFETSARENIKRELKKL